MLQSSSPRPVPESSPAVKSAMGEAVALLSKSFARAFGPKWDADVPTLEVWARMLERDGVTPETVREAIPKACRLDWPPSVGQFLTMCAPAGPDERAALREALAWARQDRGFREWSHPAVGAAARAVGTWDLRHLRDDELRRVFRKSLAQMVERFHAGQALDVPATVAIEHKPEPGPITDSVGKAAIAECMAMLGRREVSAE